MEYSISVIIIWHRLIYRYISAGPRKLISDEVLIDCTGRRGPVWACWSRAHEGSGSTTSPQGRGRRRGRCDLCPIYHDSLYPILFYWPQV